MSLSARTLPGLQHFKYEIGYQYFISRVLESAQGVDGSLYCNKEHGYYLVPSMGGQDLIGWYQPKVRDTCWQSIRDNSHFQFFHLKDVVGVKIAEFHNYSRDLWLVQDDSTFLTRALIMGPFNPCDSSLIQGASLMVRGSEDAAVLRCQHTLTHLTLAELNTAEREIMQILTEKLSSGEHAPQLQKLQRVTKLIEYCREKNLLAKLSSYLMTYYTQIYNTYGQGKTLPSGGT